MSLCLAYMYVVYVYVVYIFMYIIVAVSNHFSEDFHNTNISFSIHLSSLSIKHMPHSNTTCPEERHRIFRISLIPFQRFFFLFTMKPLLIYIKHHEIRNLPQHFQKESSVNNLFVIFFSLTLNMLSQGKRMPDLMNISRLWRRFTYTHIHPHTLPNPHHSQNIKGRLF